VSQRTRRNFRQKAMEHKRHAIAVLTAANTLKAVLAERTEAEQVSLMRHYILEFGPWVSRNAKLRNSLPEDDLRQQKLDQDRLSAAFVVSILNGILRDIAIESPR
jgi:hypothetical protein